MAREIKYHTIEEYREANRKRSKAYYWKNKVKRQLEKEELERLKQENELLKKQIEELKNKGEMM